ncbi:MAG: DNA-binding protein [Candidatus Hadarchaeales archaeon]
MEPEPDEAELEEIKRRKMLEYQARLEEQRRQAELRRQYEIQKRAILQEILTPEARNRLANIRMVKPEFAEQLELQLIQLAQSGRITSKITDEQLKTILDRLQSKRREFRIRRI